MVAASDSTDQDGTDDDFFHGGRQGKLALDEQDGPGNHARVITKKEPAKSGDRDGEVDEAVHL